MTQIINIKNKWLNSAKCTLLKCLLMYYIHLTVLTIKKKYINRLLVNVSSLINNNTISFWGEVFGKNLKKKNINCHLLSSINFIKVWERPFLPCDLLSIIGLQMKSYNPTSPTKRKQSFPYLYSHFEIYGSEYNWKIKQN